jgi:hypothetical protein
VKRLCLVIIGVVCTVAVSDAQSFCGQSKPAGAHTNVARITSSALRNGGPGGANFSNPYAPPVDRGITAIAALPAMPTDGPRFGVSDSWAEAQGLGGRGRSTGGLT